MGFFNVVFIRALPSEDFNLEVSSVASEHNKNTHQSLRLPTLRICYVILEFSAHLLANVSTLFRRRMNKYKNPPIVVNRIKLAGNFLFVYIYIYIYMFTNAGHSSRTV
jgi:hypothetical protein